MHCLVPLGRFDEALEQLRLASELDPLSPAMRASGGVVHYFAGHHEAAAAEYRAVLETHPDFALAHYFLGQALDALGRSDEAAAAIGEAARLSGRTPEIVAALGHTLARAGDRAGAEATLAELEEAARRRYVSAALPAQVHAGLGDRERAIAELTRARADRAADLIWLGVRPVFAPLHGDPEFRALLEAVGLPRVGS
jgi:serine/threonine-protein kinase